MVTNQIVATTFRNCAFSLNWFMAAIIFCVCLSPSNLVANDAAYAALELALKDCEDRAEMLGANRFSFVRNSEIDGESFGVAYSPRSDNEGDWSLLYPESEAASKTVRKALNKLSIEVGSDRKIHLSNPREYAAGGFTFHSETEDYWIFHSGVVDVASADKDERKFIRRARGRLLSELAVEKSSSRIRSLKMTNTKNIHMAPFFVIKEFYLEFLFEEAWIGGPIVQKAVKQNVSGRAVVVKFDIKKVKENTDFAIWDQTVP